MTRMTLSASFLALATAAQPVWSLTAEEAWENWQQIATEFGQTVSAGSVSKSGDALTLSDVDMRMTVDEMTMTGKTDEIVLTEQADGSVVITGSESSDMMVMIAPQFGETVETNLVYRHPDMKVVVSEAGGAVNYAYTLPSLAFELGETKVDNEVIPLNGSITASTVTGSYSSTGGLKPTITQTYSTGPMTMRVDARDPKENGTFVMDASVANLAGSSTAIGGSLFGVTDMGKLLKSGVAVQGSAVTGPISFAFDAKSPTEEVAFKMAAAGINAAGGIDKDKINYSINYNNLNFDVSGSEVPLPVVQAAVEDFGITFLAPLAKSDTPQPFVFNTTLGNVTLGDPVWNLFDPAGILPRDPSSFVVNLAGQAKVLVDVLDVDAPMGATPPAQIEALSITEILLDIAGATLMADGGFTFDNTDLVTFNGMPRPTGSLNVTLTGANALLDKLVQMGLMPADQAMGMRMMSGMVLRPGDGPDTLVSEIQVTPDGKVLANGQALPF